MAIVSVAIVLSFHLKSAPSALGMFSVPYACTAVPWGHINECRKTICAALGHHLLDSVLVVLASRTVELYSYSHAVQPAIGLGAVGLEDADCVYDSVCGHRRDLCTASLYECRGAVNIVHHLHS